MSTSVDVLALFDAYIAHGIPQERAELQRARAAVAELMAAARFSCELGRVSDNLCAALSRCGGAA